MTKAIVWDEELFRRLWQEGKTMAEIGAAFGVTDSCASKHAMVLGLPRRRPGSSRLSARVVITLYKELGIPKTAAKLKTSNCTVWRILKAYKVDTHRKTVFDFASTRAILSMRQAGMNSREISEALQKKGYNLNPKKVRNRLFAARNPNYRRKAQ